jgi:ribose transport system permease protein
MSENTPSDPGMAPAPQKAKSKFEFLRGLTLLGLLLLIWIALSLATESFLTTQNMTNLMRQTSLWAIIAIGQTFVIITGGIDLSVGAIVGLSSTVVSILLKAGFPIWAAVAITMLIGPIVGAFHAFGILRMGLPPFIITLASMTGLRGIGLLLTDGLTITGLPDEFVNFSRESFLGIPALAWMALIVAIPAFMLLHHTRWGRYIYAVGSNAEAARLSGVSISRTIYLVYITSASCATFAGILTASRISIGVATTGESWELQSIAAAVIGGASLFGAVGNVLGPVLGSLLLTTINNGANLLNINPFWQRIIAGALIVLIVWLDQMRRKKR